VKVRYFCHGCNRNKEVEVRDHGETEEVIDWMHEVSIAVARDHDQHSPHCDSRHVDLALHVGEEDKKIGTSDKGVPIDLMSRWVRERSN